MPDPRQLTDQEASQRRRAWLDDRQRWNRDLVVLLLRHAPEVDVAHALEQLPAAELQHLARLLAAATDLHQVARRIAIDLQERLDGRQAGAATPPGWNGDPDALMTRHRPPVPAERPRPLDPEGSFSCARRRRRCRRPAEGCRWEDPPSRRTGHMDRPGAGGAARARCPAVKRECPGPATAQVQAVKPFALDGLPGTTPAGHWRWSGVERAEGACCFAGKLRSTAGPAAAEGG